METQESMLNKEAGVESKKSEKSHDRSASYPALTLNEGIEFGTKVYKNFGTAVVTRQEIASVLNVHANSISRHCGACAQYGLFEKTGEGYKVSSILDRIVNPENTKDKKIAKLEAFGSPKIYKELIEKLDSTFVPNELPNTLVKHHNITAKAAPEAAEIFVKSAQEAEAMSDNRVLKYRDTLGATQKVQQYAEVYDVDNKPEVEESKTSVQLLTKTGQTVNIPQQNNTKTIPIPLTKGKEAYFAYPENMSANDVTLVEQQLKVILMRINFDNEDKEIKNGNE